MLPTEVQARMEAYASRFYILKTPRKLVSGASSFLYIPCYACAPRAADSDCSSPAEMFSFTDSFHVRTVICMPHTCNLCNTITMRPWVGV